MTENLTPWFPPEIKPVRKGVYERIQTRMTGPGGRFSYWNGKRWSCSGVDVKEANSLSGISSGEQKTDWRGLAEKPK